MNRLIFRKRQHSVGN